MTIKKKKPSKQIEIDLSGPQGNAYYLLGVAQRFCAELALDYKQISYEMKSGDYEHLIIIFDKYFGKFVTLYR